MRFPRFKVRTLLLMVIGAAILIEIAGLGHRSRQIAAQAQAAARAEQNYLRILSTSGLAAAQQREQADRLQATDPEQARTLRAQASNVIANIPFFRQQAEQATVHRVALERAMYRPWESAPPAVGRLNTTPPVAP